MLQLLQYNLYNNFSKLDGQLTMQVQSIACACKVMTFIIVKAKPKSSDEASTVLLHQWGSSKRNRCY